MTINSKSIRKTIASDKSAFGVSEKSGFLPETDPLLELPKKYAAWEAIGRELPKLLVSGRVREAVSSLPDLDISELKTEAELERAMVILSFTGHGLVWGQYPPSHSIPPSLARPWCAIAKKLGRPAVLSYASYALHNWRRMDSAGAVELGNIVLLQNFFGGVDEEWFVLVHVDIEAKAAGVVRGVLTAEDALETKDNALLEKGLVELDGTLGAMYSVLERMPEWCDPHIYFHRVRPYIFGWKNQPSLPNGMIYEGVAEFNNSPQFYRGETGAQSAIIPVCDALLGVQHKEDPLRVYLNEMRDYMPVGHRAFLKAVEDGPQLRDFVESGSGSAAVKDLYNSCINWVSRFRSLHLEYAVRYIANQAQQNPANPSQVGTGGTPFVDYLKKHRDETGQHRL